jgi:hypothetical protein
MGTKLRFRVISCVKSWLFIERIFPHKSDSSKWGWCGDKQQLTGGGGGGSSSGSGLKLRSTAQHSATDASCKSLLMSFRFVTNPVKSSNMFCFAERTSGYFCILGAFSISMATHITS